MKGQCEYEIKWTRAGKGIVTIDRGYAIHVIDRILKDREQGMGAGKITIIQRRVTEEAGA